MIRPLRMFGAVGAVLGMLFTCSSTLIAAQAQQVREHSHHMEWINATKSGNYSAEELRAFVEKARQLATIFDFTVLRSTLAKPLTGSGELARHLGRQVALADAASLNTTKVRRRAITDLGAEIRKTNMSGATLTDFVVNGVVRLRVVDQVRTTGLWKAPQQSGPSDSDSLWQEIEAELAAAESERDTTLAWFATADAEAEAEYNYVSSINWEEENCGELVSGPSSDESDNCLVEAGTVLGALAGNRGLYATSQATINAAWATMTGVVAASSDYMVARAAVQTFLAVASAELVWGLAVVAGIAAVGYLLYKCIADWWGKQPMELLANGVPGTRQHHLTLVRP